MEYYGTVTGADTYFDERLHTDAWDTVSSAVKLKALKQATRIIDNLNFKGVKAALYSIMYDANDDKLTGTSAPTRDAKITADASQELEFPRGKDSSVPDRITWATYEIAYALVDGVDPEMEQEALRVRQQVYGQVRTTYTDLSLDNVEHLMYGVPSSVAWRFLKPFLDDDNGIGISRVN
jgi:hypothetical protein